jgi:tetratricopeptide (TPR) repeat protein
MSIFSRLARKLKPNETPQEPVVVPQGKTDEELAEVMVELLERSQELNSGGKIKGFLMARRVKEQELAEWLGRYGGSFSIEQMEWFAGAIDGILGATAREILPSVAARSSMQSDYSDNTEMEEIQLEADVSLDLDEWLCLSYLFHGVGDFGNAIASYDQALQIKPDLHEAWSSRGVSLANLGQYESAIASYDQALQIKPDYHNAWFNRGVSLAKLGQYESAIASYDQALQIKPDYHNAWFNRGVSLAKLGQYESAIASYDQALQIKPDYHNAWSGRGVSLANLGQYESAIASYDQALQIKPDLYEALCNRGVSLANLGQYESAIASFDQALQIKPDLYEAWNGRGASLGELGQNESSIASYDQALQIKPDSHEAWSNRSVAAFSGRGSSAPNVYTQAHPALNDRGYPGQLASLTIGLTYCPSAIAQGFLQRAIGNAHWDHARTDVNPGPYWREAVTAYSTSLQSLPSADYPEEHLETLQAAIPALIALQEIESARKFQTHGIQLFNQLRAKTPNKQTFDTKFAKFSRTEIDLLIGENNPVKALEQAEFYKNRALTWILDEWQETSLSPSYQAIRSLLTPTTAILYWHLSENALTTIILTPSNDHPIVLPVDRYQKSIDLTKLLTDYKSKYNSYRNLPKDTAPAQRQQHPWRRQLPEWLDDRLTEILDINAIVPHLNNIQNLILLPHRDLHLLPIHTLLTPYTCTYLPSLQTALTLRPKPSTDKRLLAIDDHTNTLKYSRLESAIVRSLLPCKTHLTPAQATHEGAIAALNQAHNFLHFSGHGAYDTLRPQNSAIALAEQNLTAKAIATLDLSTYQLITLAACETGLTGKDTTTEYIGITSAFLKANAQTILSTLWQVDELSSTWLIVRFYQAYLQGNSPAQALAIAQTWIKTLTYPDLALWLEDILRSYPTIDYRDRLLAHLSNIRETQGTIEPAPFEAPYHWAGFIITGTSQS